MPNHHHRAGSLKQTNKRNKRTKASKRSLSRLAGGKVEGRVGFKQQLVAHTKADRRHIQQQKRDAKRQELLRRRRGLDGGQVPPRVVGIISLGPNEETEEKLRSLLLQQADRVSKPHQSGEGNSIVNVKYNVHKKDGNLTLMTNSSAFRSQYGSENDEDAAVFAALDLCRICDLVLFVIDGNASGFEGDVVGISIGGDDDASTSTKKTNATTRDFDHLISSRGDRILAAVKGQGLPKVVTILAHTEKDKEEFGGEDYMSTQSAKSIRRGNLKRRTELRKFVSRFATTEFGVDNEKVIEVDLATEDEDGMDQDTSHAVSKHVKTTLAAALIRSICTMSANASKWVSQLPRSYLISDTHHYSVESQELRVTGYVRGLVPFDVNSLIHIPNLGTFGCKSIEKSTNAFERKKVGTVETEEPLSVVLSDPQKRESLEMFATPDALEGEQNLVGFDEEDEDLSEHCEDSKGGEPRDDFARPAGWSDYQSAWLDAVDDVSVAEGELDHGELARELNKKSSASTIGDGAMDLDEANQISEEERQALLAQRRKEQKEHQDFPDEVEVKEDEKARDRFARYRSLKSFRKSHWDPKENLPESYSSIYHIASFKATQRSVMSEMKELSKASQDCDGQFWDGEAKVGGNGNDIAMQDGSDDEDENILRGCVPSGSYVTLTIEQVPKEVYARICPDAPITAVTLLPHENKVSVLHMGLSHSNSCEMSVDVPVKSKDKLMFRCGWRTWEGRPVFSQNNLNCDKHKFERFLPQVGSFFAASIFGPVTYTPCPVLVFRDHKGRKEMVAIGSMIGADADRIVIKRIVLTGYPVKVRKRYATVKYMFYDPEDVKWFKPAGLTTKHGLHGNIEESVGDHGTMKCLFNAPIKQHDTVCMPLYKRIYPKFCGDQSSGTESATVRTNAIRDRSVLVIR